jgi:2-amino-4-hydroxy-6-hydroxymethyldihydropteridine diphosphokinase
MQGQAVTCHIGLGANLDEPIATLRTAAKRIAELRGCTNVRCSSIYRSAPQETNTPQPDYFNAVVALDTTRTAAELWHDLHALERELGRTRTRERNVARTIDIDFLLYGDNVVETPNLVLPHPRIVQRAFVLLPLIELASNIAIPGRGLARDFLDRVKHQRIEQLIGDEGWLCN